jgi:uncharacterized protein (DUF924 family)
MFVYLPLLHSEDIAEQHQAHALLTELSVEGANPSFFGGVFPRLADAAAVNIEVLRSFGRFPERNHAVGRSSTADEKLYLAGLGSIALD